MKRFSLSSVFAVVAASLIAAAAASGQASIPRPYALGVYGGASMPVGDFKNQADVGFHLGAFGSTTLSGNLSIRLDAAYNNFGSKSFAETNASISEKSSVIHTTLDAEYSLGAQTEMASGGGALPYISGGAGFYRFSFDDSCSGTGCSAFDLGTASETHWGLNAGGGAVFFLSGFTPFVDVHFHTIFPKSGQEGRANMILASFGLKF
jgi:opacity protein-like surface antigen